MTACLRLPTNFVHHQCHLENRLTPAHPNKGKPAGRRLIRTASTPALFPSVGVFVGAAIKTVKLVVQDTGEGNQQFPSPRT